VVGALNISSECLTIRILLAKMKYNMIANSAKAAVAGTKKLEHGSSIEGWGLAY